MTTAGIVLLVMAIGMLLRRGQRQRTDPGGGPLGRVLLVTSAAAARLPGLGRPSDATLLAVRIAAAPRAWPARWMAAGLRAAGHAAQQRPDAAPTDLRRVAAGTRLACAAGAATPAAALAVLSGGRGAMPLIAAAAVAGASRLPDLALAVAAKWEQRTAAREAAATVDLLAASASAGLSLPEAMVLTANHAAPPLAAVLRAAAIRRAMGNEPRRALADEAARHGLPLLGDVAVAMERQRRLGVPLGPELARIATRMRADQRAAALQRAARRGPLATLAVALVIAPACIAAVIACLAGGLLEGGALPLQ